MVGNERLCALCWDGEIKQKRHRLVPCEINDKPDSVLPGPRVGVMRRHRARVVNMINLHNVLPQNVKPSTRSLTWDRKRSLFEVAAHRDCPFHPIFIDSSLLL